MVLSLGCTPSASCTNLIVFYSCNVCVCVCPIGWQRTFHETGELKVTAAEL